jgi:hypothetical protein
VTLVLPEQKVTPEQQALRETQDLKVTPEQQALKEKQDLKVTPALPDHLGRLG